MADHDDMLTVEPEEPVIHDVKVQHAYRTTVSLRNNTRNALEVSIRAGSPERWAVAPSSVFLEAGRTMRVDLRLKLTRELRPKRLAGGAGAVGSSSGDTQHDGVDTITQHRQRDVFHVKTEYFERRFHASFTVAGDESGVATKEIQIEDRGRSVSFASGTTGGTSGTAETTDQQRSTSPGRGRFVGSNNPPGTSASSARAAQSSDDKDPAWSSARVRKSEIAILDDRLDHLEKSNKRASLDIKDKDELIRALRSRLALVGNTIDAREDGDDSRDATETRQQADEKIGIVSALSSARATISELTGANAALRARCDTLDGEASAARAEAVGLRRRLSELAGDKAPQLTDLVASALHEERNAYEQQSLKALRVLEAKDAVLFSREREVAEARADIGAAQTTLTATRRELDLTEGKLIASLDETSALRRELFETQTRASGKEKQARDTTDALQKELEQVKEKALDSRDVAEKIKRLEEELVFSRAETDANQRALEASSSENQGLRGSLKTASLEREHAFARRETVEKSVRNPSGGKPPLPGATAFVAVDATATATVSKETPSNHVYPETMFVQPELVVSSDPRLVVGEITRLRDERDALVREIGEFRETATGATLEARNNETKQNQAKESLASASAGRKESNVTNKELAALRLQVKELQTALRLRDGDARRSAAAKEADRVAETESLRTELAAMRDRLTRTTRDGKSSKSSDSQRDTPQLAHEPDFAAAEKRARLADAKADAAEREAKVSRDRLAEYELNDRRHRNDAFTAGPSGIDSRSSGAEQRLSGKVTTLTAALGAANRRVVDLENAIKTHGGKMPKAVTWGAPASASDDAQEIQGGTDPLNVLSIRWENERARLESKLRAAKEDGAVRVQALEASLASLRSRSGLHAEVARLGDAIGSSARAEIKARHDLKLAEEKLGKALLRLRGLGVDEEVDEATLSTHAADQARRLGSIAVHGGVAGGVDGLGEMPTGSGNNSVKSRGGFDRDATRYHLEIDRLRAECERVALESGREQSARADAARELASALDRVADRDRALHDVREQAALGRERAAATRSRELGEATRSRAAAEARAVESEQAAADAKEDARAARTECALRVAAADAARRFAERTAELAKQAASIKSGEAVKAKRDAERAHATLDERAVQLRILTETVEALQASAGSGDREQRIVTLAAQAATARASEAALERRCAELSAEASGRVTRVADLEKQLLEAERGANAADTRADAACTREALACDERAAAREESSAVGEEAAALSRRVDIAQDAQASAEAREHAARVALEHQHVRHVEQLQYERESANDRLRKAADNAARAAGVVGVVSAASYGNAFHTTFVHRDALLDAVRDACAIRERIERHLIDVSDTVKALLISRTQREKENKENENVEGKQDAPSSKRGVGASFPVQGVKHSGGDLKVNSTSNTTHDNQWAFAVLQRLRQLVLEAEREVGRATVAARTAAAGESAAHRRAAAAEAALDARTAAWEEATSCASAAEERSALRTAVAGRCAEERARFAYARVAKLEDALVAATRKLTEQTGEANREKRCAVELTRAVDSLARRARVAEADATAAKQAAHAAAEELEGSPNGGDAVRDLKAYFESEVVGRMILGTRATDENKTNEQATENARLVGVTRELCAAKLTERSLLASLAANRRRADAAAAHAVELRASLDVAETRLAEVTRAAVENEQENTNENASELAAKLSREAHVAREETLRLRARVSELELETAELAGGREAALAAAKAAREGARAEIAAASARDNEAFAAKASSLRRESEAECGALRASLREAQSRAQTARAETAAIQAEGALFEDASATPRWRGVASSAAEVRAEKAESKARKAQTQLTELKDELKLKERVVEQLRHAFDVSAGTASSSKKAGKRPSGAAVDAAVVAASAIATSSAVNAALGRRLVEARLAEADAQRRLKITSRAENEYRAMVADRDSKLVALEQKLRDAGRDIATGGATIGTAAPPRAQANSSLVPTPKSVTSRSTPTKQPFKPPGTTSRAAAVATEGKDNVNAKGKSIASLAAAAASARRGLMPVSVSDEDEATVSSSLESRNTAATHNSPHEGFSTYITPEVLASGDIVHALALESEVARLRVARQRADNEVERLAAELAAFKAHAPEPEEMDALRDEACALRERIAVLNASGSPEELQRDINSAVVSAAAALSGGTNNSGRYATNSNEAPKPGSAAAATEHLVGALRETRNELFRAKQDVRDMTRTLREKGKEKDSMDGAEQSRREVIRELTQRASQLGKDKAELVDERDKLRERCRALRKERDATGSGDDLQNTNPGLAYTDRKAANASSNTCVDCAMQAGPSLGDAGALVDATSLGEVLRQRVAGVERASAFCLRRAKSQSGGDVAEVAIEANLLAVDAAALRAVVEALCSAGTRNENLSPTEMVTAAAMAAMRAMPGAPVVHHVMPSVVAAAMQMAPLVADRNTIDAPVAYRARTQRNVATDVDGLAAVMRDVGVDTGPLTSATRSGPDARDDPEVVISAPRDVGTSPGICERVRNVSVGVNVGGQSSPPPRGYFDSHRNTRETGVDPKALMHDAATATELSTANFNRDMTAVAERDALVERNAELAKAEVSLKEKTQKWKLRCESLRGELGRAMEKTAQAETAAETLRASVAKTEAAGTVKAQPADAGSVSGDLSTDTPIPQTPEAIAAALTAALGQAKDAVAAADALRDELASRDEEHARAVSATRSAIRNLRGSSPADRAAYLEALRIHADDASARRREREFGKGDVLRSALLGGGGGGANGHALTKTAPSLTTAAASAKKQELATANGKELLRRVTAAETRLTKAVASTATALAVAEQGARRSQDRFEKEAVVIAARVEETDRLCAVARAECASLKNAAARSGSTARWGHVSKQARYRTLLKELLEEHKCDRAAHSLELAELQRKVQTLETDKSHNKTLQTTASDSSKTIATKNPIFSTKNDDVSPPKRRRGALASDDAMSPIGRVRAAVVEIETRRERYGGAVRRAVRPAGSSVSSDSGSDAGPAAAAAKAELKTTQAPFALGGRGSEFSVYDIETETTIPTTTPLLLAATKARELLGKLLAAKDDVERLDWLEQRAVATERELERLRSARDAATACGAKAERRAKHLTGRVEQLRRALSEAEKVSTSASGPAAFAKLEQRAFDAETKLGKAKSDSTRLKSLSGDIKNALDRVKAEREKVFGLEKSLAAAEAKACSTKTSLDRRDSAIADLQSKLESAAAQVLALETSLAAMGGSAKAHGDALKSLRDERDKLKKEIVKAKEKFDIDVRDAAVEAEAAERARNAETTKRLKREAKRIDAVLKSHETRVDAARGEADHARDTVCELERKSAETRELGVQSTAAARRHSIEMLGGVRSLAQTVVRLAAAVGHTVGAASSHKTSEQTATEAAAAALVDFAPDEIAALLGADENDGLNGPSGSLPIRGGAASTPESFHQLVLQMETKAENLLNGLVAVGEREFTGRTDSDAFDSLRWILAAATAEAEHAESALRRAVPSMEDWWNGNGKDASAISQTSVRTDTFVRTDSSERKDETPHETTRGRGKQSGREKKFPQNKKTDTETGTRFNLTNAARLLASSDDGESN